MLGQMLMRVLARAEGFSVCGTARPDAPGLNRFAAENGVVALSRLVREEGPFDLVINAIGVRSDRIDESDFRSVQRAIVANALLPHHLAAVAEEAAVRVIQVSTDGVFARDAGATLVHVSLPDQRLRLLRAGGWVEYANGSASPERLRSALAAGLLRKGSRT